jgi:hypothetical protein
MLKGVGRWLRAAGYEVEIADDGGRDDDLLTRARAENRLLFTRNRRLAARFGDDPVLAVLATESPAEVARELSVRPGSHWLPAPLIR